MTVVPRLYVDAPVVDPYECGLFSVARPLTIPADDPHWQIGGVEWESIAAVPVQAYLAGLLAGHGSAVTKSLPDNPATTTAWPSAVFGGIDCGTIGRPQPEYEERARAIVALNAQHAVEATLWSGLGVDTSAQPGPGLNATSAAVDLTPGGGPTPLVNGIGLLEAWLAGHYGGRGILHATRQVAGFATQLQNVRPISDEPGPDKNETCLGTYWSFGGGYDGSGPGNSAPAAGTTWLYITGQVTLNRSDVLVPATFQQAINRTLNREFLVAEQINLVGVDGPWAACHVTLP